MPLDQRQKGMALAQSMATAKKPAVPRSTDEDRRRPNRLQPKPIAPKPAPAKAVAASPTLARPVAAASGKWRIQLGAFGQRKSAETLFGKLCGKLGGRQAFYIPAGAVVRLQVGPFESRAAASAACARLAPQPCFPVGGP